MSILIIGGSGGTNIGDSLFRAASKLNLNPIFFNSREAYDAPILLRRLNWHCFGRRPAKIALFSRKVEQACMDAKPKYLVATGIAPICRESLIKIGKIGICRINYLTDDPWNPAHYALWFIKALPDYDIVFSQRKANTNDLRAAGCKKVKYLPFGFEPELIYYENPSTGEEEKQFSADVVFAGSADKDRLPYILALVNSNIKFNLYGEYWQRYAKTRNHSRGQADVRTYRLAISAAKVAVCFVRRSNRDGHSMRSFEIPAIGTCMLTEYTEEHHKLFGKDGQNVLYFKTIDEMVKKARFLLKDEGERSRLAKAAHALITNGKHTYKDRLITMLELSKEV